MKIKRIMLLGLILAELAVYVSCRKIDRQLERPVNQNKENRFFGQHLPTDTRVIAAMRFLKSENDIKKFVEKTVSLIGYPYWDKAMVYSNKLMENSRGSTADSVSVIFVPFVRDSQNVVNASLQIVTTANDTTYSYLCDWQYRDTVATALSAKEQSLLLMHLDKNVFGSRMYKITDSAAFGTTGSAIKYVRIDSVSMSRFINPIFGRGADYYMWIPIEVCYTGWQLIPLYQGQVVGCSPDANCPFYTWETTCETVLYYAHIVTGSGSGGTGGGSGGSGGSGGGSGIPPECEPVIQRNANPVEGCDPGWVPESGPSYNPTLGAALFNNFTVSSYDQIKIDFWKTNNLDTSGLDSCRIQLLKKLINALPSSPLGAFLSKLDKAVALPSSPDKFIIHFKTRPLPNQNALTEHASYDASSNEYEVDIVIDSATSTNATELFVANLFLHEVVHAYMAYIWRKFNQGASIAEINGLNPGKVFNAYVDTLRKRDPLNPNMLQWFTERFQHNYMADQLLEYIADIIKLFDNNPSTPDRYYWYLAWSGLTRKSIKTWDYYWPNYPTWPPSNPSPSEDSTRGLKYPLTLSRIDSIYNKVLDDEEYSKPNAKGRRPIAGSCY